MTCSRWISLATAAVFAALVVLPVVAALSDDDGRCCRRGVCCHRPNPSADTCVRAACRCGAHGDNAGIPVLLPLATLEDGEFLVRESPNPRRILPVTFASVASWRPDTPDPPPRLRLHA